MIAPVASLLSIVILLFAMSGIILRVKSIWAGRLGPPMLQPAFDVVRLLRKRSVYSATTTAIFRVAPWIYLVTSLAGIVVLPVAGLSPLVSFPADLIWLGYAWGLGRMALMLASLDTGSSFEGMGASREATYAALAEPVLFLVLASMGLLGDSVDLASTGIAAGWSPARCLARVMAAAALFIVLQVEAARIPVDDPCTHLELTMVHEVMVLDHSGPDLAAIQVGTSVRLLGLATLVSQLLNPLASTHTVTGSVTAIVSTLLVAVAVGLTESIVARLKMRSIPAYIGLAALCGIASLVIAAGLGGVR